MAVIKTELPSSEVAFEVSDEMARLNSAWSKEAQGRKQTAKNLGREKNVGPVRVETIARKLVRVHEKTFTDIGL